MRDVPFEREGIHSSRPCHTPLRRRPPGFALLICTCCMQARDSMNGRKGKHAREREQSACGRMHIGRQGEKGAVRADALTNGGEVTLWSGCENGWWEREDTCGRHVPRM